MNPSLYLSIYLLFSHVSFINTFKRVKDTLYVILWFLYFLGFLFIEQIIFVIYLSIYLYIRLSIYLYFYLSIYISIYLSPSAWITPGCLSRMLDTLSSKQKILGKYIFYKDVFFYKKFFERSKSIG